jgi:hypothetical protein
MKAFRFATFAATLVFISSECGAAPSTVTPRSERVTITATDPSRGLLTVSGDGFRETIDAHMADIRFRQPTGHTTKRTLADIRPGMTGTVTAHWGTATLATKIVIQSK